VRLALSRLTSLIGLIVVVWLSIVFGLFIVFRVIFEITLSWQNAFTPAIVGVSRVVLGAGFGLGWLLLWWKLANVYLWKKLRRHE